MTTLSLQRNLMLWPLNIMTGSEMKLKKLLKAGVIQESHSSWSDPIVIVPKGDGGKRLCVDFRALNAITRTYVWPMPLVEEIFAKLGKAKFFITLNLRSCYHHIALDNDAIKKTASVTPLGKYAYLKSPIWPSSITCLFSKPYEEGSKWTAFYFGLFR